jgi:hypothetical protein
LLEYCGQKPNRSPDPSQSGTLMGVLGIGCHSINETARLHLASRRGGNVWQRSCRYLLRVGGDGTALFRKAAKLIEKGRAGVKGTRGG